MGAHCHGGHGQWAAPPSRAADVDRERGALLFEPSAWQAFVDAVRDGEFDS